MPIAISTEERRQLSAAVARCMLKHGLAYRSDIRLLRTFWPEHLLERGVAISRRLLTDTVSKASVKDALAHLDDIGGNPAYTRDFFEGLCDAAGTVTRNGAFRRLQFNGRPQLREFLESGDHGQNIELVAQSTSALTRTQALYLLDAPCRDDVDQYFCGLLAGAEIERDAQGLPVARAKRPKIEHLQRLGVLFDSAPDGIDISPFYILLYCGDLPVEIASAWFAVLRKKRSVKDALVASINWRAAFGTKKPEMGGLPYLVSATHACNIGIGVRAVKAEIRNRRLDHVDRRLRDRCVRWYRCHKAISEDAHE